MEISKLRGTKNGRDTSQMPLVLLISMERSKARRARAVAALTRLGLRYEWVRAIDGKELSDSEVGEIHSNQKMYKLSRGEIGCYQSHLKCQRIISERNLPYAMIMEDDMPVNEKLLDVLARLAHFPPDWDIVNLSPDCNLVGNRQQAFHSPSLRHRKALGDGLFVGRYLFGTWHAGLYLIKARYIAKFGKKLLPIHRPIDSAMFRLGYSPNFPYALYEVEQGQCFAVPNMEHGEDADSEIDAIGERDRNLGKPSEQRPIQHGPKTHLLDLLRKIYFVFDPFLMRVMVNMRWREAGKPSYMSDYPPGALRLRILIWRSCVWRDLPFALVRAMLPQRWL